jgi:subtilase family serine protease
MQTKNKLSLELFAVFVFSSLAALSVGAQTPTVQSRITAPMDETKLTLLSGNTHPLARLQFDRGLAPASLPMDGMLLVLKRSPAQQAALEQLIAEQQDHASPNYHKWLTPVEFGQQFGPSDQDIQTITSWLESHGFRVGNVTNGRTVIEFSGTAGQVQEALHTSIHQYVVNGEDHWANSSDPSIPTALTPVVAGVRSLHNFHPKPMNRVSGVRPSGTTDSRVVKPEFTYPTGCTATNCNFGLGPTDFATIYNVLPLWNAGIDGTGETIAVVSDSNISLQDVTDFRSMFGLPPKLPVVTVPTSIPGCIDPGLQPKGDEIEAILDVEWSGAVAKNANINLVTCATTNASFGGDLAAEYIINNPNHAPILSESFGACEFDLGTAGNALYNSFWSQAAAEGITVIVSSGDNGSAGCDITEVNGPATQPAQQGLQVSGVASTPFNLAIGGTEFNDFANPFQFWQTATGNSASTGASALSYIPETTWNDSCTNSIVYTGLGFSSASAACNNTTVQSNGFVVPVGSSGGMSNCTTYNGNNPANCTGGYAKPTWQTGVGVPSDGKRDIPDISVFAGDGLSGSFYIVCERDFPGTTSAACNLNVTKPNFLSVGGTSVATQAFAGIMALIDQKNESAEGLANPILYTLAAAAGNSCASMAGPSPTCVFYDVADGSTNAMPCQAKATTAEPVVSPDCPVPSSGNIGILTNPANSQIAYSAGTGYDLTTGLGSINAFNLVNAPVVWNTATSTHGADFTLSFNGPSTVTIPRGSQGTVGLTVTAENGFTGTVALSCVSATLPSEVTCSNPSINGSGSGSVSIITTAASAVPAWKLNAPAKWTPGQLVMLVCFLSMGVMTIGLRRREQRWSTAFGLIALATVVSCAACSGGGGSTTGGGGGSGGGGTTNPGTPTGTSVIVITATSGTIQRSLAVTLTVD